MAEQDFSVRIAAMIYHDFQSLKLPSLGLGMMRLPTTGGSDSAIDEAKVQTMVDYALDHGVNYFDTAFMYHGEKSEEVTGRVLKHHSRDSFFLADKFPGQKRAQVADVPRTFETQLKRCGTDYFDFYLLHCVYEDTMPVYMNEGKNGIIPYLMKQKKAGRIRHLGFSCHGVPGTLERFLERWHNEMEFCQIQLNYLDWHLQEAEKKVEILRCYHLPIWVMEPLRGGKLANLLPEDENGLRKMDPERSPHEWSFRFLQSIPEVKMILSGMSNMDQLKDNVRIFSESKPLTEPERNDLIALGDRMILRGGLPCTGCRYCTANCPKKLDIPFLLAQYNEHVLTNGGWMAKMMVNTLPADKRPEACIGCCSCEKMCPQRIKISDAMKKFADGLKA